MISRRQIIESQQQAELDERQAAQQQSNEGAGVGGRPSSSRSGRPSMKAHETMMMAMMNNKPTARPSQAQQPDVKRLDYKQQVHSRRIQAAGYKLDPFQDDNHDLDEDEEEEDEDLNDHSEAEEDTGSGGADTNNLHEADYRHFDPYSVYGEEDEEEDVWYSEERLFEDHIQEIVDKWLAIDDEIWAKIICMERNRRVAKAYARKHALTVNGSVDEYLDGTTLGLNSFDNPDRDAKTRHVKQYIGQGLRIRISQSGDILVKRLSKANVFVQQLSEKQYNNSDARLMDSNSSSDPYAMNSDSAGDLYGIVGPLYRAGDALHKLHNDGGGVFGSRHTPSKEQPGQHRRVPDSVHSRSSKLASSSDVSSSSSSGPSTFGGNVAKRPTNSSTTTAAAALKQQPRSVALEYNQPTKIFDMGQFKALLERESRRPYPNRRLLQSQCVSIISFVADDQKLLNLPAWIMIINIVAIDLLKTELGLLDPSDLFGGAGVSSSSFGGLTDPLASERQMLAAQHWPVHSDRESMSPPAATKSAAVGGLAEHAASLYPHSDRILNKQSQLAASKRAFANAAALGAYNGNHHHYNGTQAHHHQLLANKPSRRVFREAAANNGASSRPKLSDLEALQHQSSGSSSGFNSHCSSQNDSSAASSSSNIAGSSGGACAGSTDELLAPIADADGGGRATKKNCSSSILSTAAETGAASRGKRPPKLPHRMTPVKSSKMSNLIPIPAPPTSPGDGPSGKANLILVSPTGLSPPMAKRKGPSGRKGDSSSSSSLLGGGVRAKGASQLDLSKIGTSEFSTIRHIDEQGQCSVLLDERRDNDELENKPPPAQRQTGPAAKQQLPAGIPAHAQLAPPATQRHILRYLMSATRGQLAELDVVGKRVKQPPNRPAATKMAPPPPPPPIRPGRYQRPLPILPGQKTNGCSREQQEENLYYCGLQARVPVRRPAPLAPVYPVTKNAINAILSDFRGHQRQPTAHRYNHQQQQQLRQQFSLTNLHNHHDPAQSVHTNNNNNSSSNGGFYNGGYLSRHYGSSCQLSPQQGNTSYSSSVTRPLMKLFKSSHGGAGGKAPSTTTNGKQLFSSVDNLHQKSASSSILGQMGLALVMKGAWR